MAEIFSRPEEVTTQWLNQVLEDSGSLEAARIVSFDFELIGTGKMGDNARFWLHYGGDPGRAPRTLVGKFPAADETARAMAGGGGAYYNEVMFYRELAPQTSMRTPTVYAAEVSDCRTEFTLLMEDLAPAEPGNNLVGDTRQRAQLVLVEAAKLAAAFYGQPDLGLKDYEIGRAHV